MWPTPPPSTSTQPGGNTKKTFTMFASFRQADRRQRQPPHLLLLQRQRQPLLLLQRLHPLQVQLQRLPQRQRQPQRPPLRPPQRQPRVYHPGLGQLQVLLCHLTRVPRLDHRALTVIGHRLSACQAVASAKAGAPCGARIPGSAPGSGAGDGGLASANFFEGLFRRFKRFNASTL
jgi:hypothetical protein